MVPTNPALTVTGSLSEFSASAFSFKSLRTTSPIRKGEVLESSEKFNGFYIFKCYGLIVTGLCQSALSDKKRMKIALS